MSLPSFSLEEENQVSNGDKVIAWDFKGNEILIKNMYIQTLSGKEAIKNKIIKIIKTDKAFASIYKNSSYGIDRLSILGKEFYSSKTKVEALVEDMKNQIKKILGVNDVLSLNSEMEDSVLTVSFTVDTIYGVVEEVLNV